jgi:hypothetical protein
MNPLDQQLRQWATRLRDDLKIAPPASNELASTIVQELRGLDQLTLRSLRSDSPVPFEQRLDEVQAFQAWMDLAHGAQHPAVVRAQVITQNYVCFVYLSEAWFKRLLKVAPPDSTTKKCCRFLTDKKVRAFRNAVAHANWRYNATFSGLEFWAHKGADPKEPMEHFEVTQNDLNFWQALARCTAYASFEAVRSAE